MLPATTKRVSENTEERINERIREETECNLAQILSASPAAVESRLAELEREWDVERILEMNASALALTGVILGLTVSRKWLVVPAIVTGFLLQHALQGWCPPIPLLRRLRVRTETEIAQERYALKALRGDFEGIRGEGGDRFQKAERLLEAVRR
jgi:hypothetical protein